MLNEEHGVTYSYDPANIDDGIVYGQGGGILVSDMPFGWVGAVLVLSTGDRPSLLYQSPDLPENCIATWTSSGEGEKCFDSPVSTRDGLAGVSLNNNIAVLGDRLSSHILVSGDGDMLQYREIATDSLSCSTGDGWEAPICFDFESSDSITVFECDTDLANCSAVKTIGSDSIGGIINFGATEFAFESGGTSFCVRATVQVETREVFCSRRPLTLLATLGDPDRGSVFVEEIDDDGFSAIHQVDFGNGEVRERQQVAQRAMLPRLLRTETGPVLVYNEMSRGGDDLRAVYRRLALSLPAVDSGAD